MKCLNCDTLFEEARHCPECGQRSATTRLSWRDILANIHHQLLEGNLPWPRTLWRMTLNPGEVAREFVGGKRVYYVHPLKYAFYLILITTLLMSDFGGFGGRTAWYSQLSWLQNFLIANPPAFMLLVSPVAAVTLRILFWRPFNMIEIWVFVLYLLGQLSLLFVAVDAISGIAAELVKGNELLQAIIVILSLMVFFVYYIWGVRGFFRGRLDWSLVGALLSMTATLWAAGMLYLWLTDPF
jgi:hypothetical protein